MVVIEIKDNATPLRSKKYVTENETPQYSFKNVSYDPAACKMRATKISVFPSDGSLRGIAEACAASYIQSVWRGCSYRLRVKAIKLRDSAITLETATQIKQPLNVPEINIYRKQCLDNINAITEMKDEFDDENDQTFVKTKCPASLIKISPSPPIVEQTSVSVSGATPEPQVPYPDGVNRRSKRRDVIKTGCINAFGKWTNSSIELEHAEVIALWHLHNKPSPAVKKRYEASLLGYDSKRIGERRNQNRQLTYNFPLDRENLSGVQEVVIMALQNDRSRKQNFQRRRRNSVTSQTAASVQRTLLHYLKLPVDAALYLMKYKKLISYSKSQILSFFITLGSFDARMINKFKAKKSQQIPEKDLMRIRPIVLRQRTRIALDVLHFVSRWELALSSDRRQECKTPNKENIPTKEQKVKDIRVPMKSNARRKPLCHGNYRAPLVMSTVNLSVPFDFMVKEDSTDARETSNNSNNSAKQKKTKKGSIAARKRNQNRKPQHLTQVQRVINDFKITAPAPSTCSQGTTSQKRKVALGPRADYTPPEVHRDMYQAMEKKTSETSSETKFYDSSSDGFSEPSANEGGTKFDGTTNSRWTFRGSRTQETKYDCGASNVYIGQRTSPDRKARSYMGQSSTSSSSCSFDDVGRNALTSEARLNMILERLRQRASVAGY